MRKSMAWITFTSLALAASVALTPAHAAPAAGRAGDADRFDLATLADGESRSFGEGESVVVASRAGDVVTIRLEGEGHGREKSISCKIGQDTCSIVTADGTGHTMVFVGDPGEAGEDSLVMALRGEAGNDEDVRLHAPGGEWSALPGGHRQVKVLRLHGGDALAPDATLLRCPEGDTTMVVKKDDPKAGYSCPRHGVALEEAKAPHTRRKVIIRKHGEPSSSAK